jgi:UDP-N-acetylmuramoylalanine--D-glutamate ligase
MKNKFFKGKKITVMGLGLLGRGVGDVAFLAGMGADVIVTDLKTKKELAQSLKQLRRFKNIHYTLGRHEMRDFENRDFILKAAGVPSDSPFINHARKNNIPVYMSTALFALLSKAKIVGVTGTRGKTTVTYMLYNILKASYKGKSNKIFIGGNILGVATLPFLSKIKKGDIAVLELDSWQMQGFGDLKISPQFGVFTTFMPDHLNYYHGSMTKYFADKANIFKYQKKGDVFIAGSSLKTVKYPLPKRTRFVSEEYLPKDLKLSVFGLHNRHNAAIAFRVARELGVKDDLILKSLSSFTGVPGRLEKIGSIKGVSVYNDTTATTPHALVSALKAVGTKRNIVLIMGGSDKAINLKILKKPLQKYCKKVFLLPGSGTDRLLKEKIVSLGSFAERVSDLKTAVKKAVRQAEKGEVLLLSPGFASFGMFKNEYDRGDRFVALVESLLH